ncbi:MAG: hypothetical protein Q7R40_17110 [Phaeospirillum sp.]|nr:hypothetical protein [Phaeospirillum sp.]
MTETDINALAAAIPAWKLFQRFFPGVEITSAQADADAPEVITYPDGFEVPSEEHLLALRLDLAREIIGTQYQRDRIAAYLPAGDTLDGILKGLAALREQGTTLPEDTLRVLDHWQAVKASHPKPKE